MRGEIFYICTGRSHEATPSEFSSSGGSEQQIGAMLGARKLVACWHYVACLQKGRIAHNAVPVGRRFHHHRQVEHAVLSFSARRPRPSGLGMTGALARRVLHCLPTAGPAGIYACGAGPTTKAPMNVSAGHSVLPSGEHAWSAVFSPGIPCL